MSDLHDRIAATLASNWPAPWHGSDRQHKQVSELSEMIIESLSLKLEKDFGCPTAGHHGCRCSYRWVGEWSEDE